MAAAMHIGAANASGASRYRGLIYDMVIYDGVILPYGAYNVPAAWGDTTGKTDPTVMVYWDAASTQLNVGTGTAVTVRAASKPEPRGVWDPVL